LGGIRYEKVFQHFRIVESPKNYLGEQRGHRRRYGIGTADSDENSRTEESEDLLG